MERLVVIMFWVIVLCIFTSCEKELIPTVPEIDYQFKMDGRTYQDLNGYYHLTIDTTKWQTIHRISGRVYRDGESVNVLKFGWGSSHYWIIGD